MCIESEGMKLIDEKIFELVYGVKDAIIAAQKQDINLIFDRINKITEAQAEQKTETELIKKSLNNGIKSDISAIKNEIEIIKKRYDDDKKCREEEERNKDKKILENKKLKIDSGRLNTAIIAIIVSVILTVTIRIFWG